MVLPSTVISASNLDKYLPTSRWVVATSPGMRSISGTDTAFPLPSSTVGVVASKSSVNAWWVVSSTLSAGDTSARIRVTMPPATAMVSVSAAAMATTALLSSARRVFFSFRMVFLTSVSVSGEACSGEKAFSNNSLSCILRHLR